MTSDSRLEKILSNGDFAVTSECGTSPWSRSGLCPKEGRAFKGVG